MKKGKKILTKNKPKKKSNSKINKKDILELYIKSSKCSPEVIFNTNTNTLEIKGISVMKNAKNFYDPLSKWLEKNWTKIKLKFILVLAFNFFNAKSAKMIFEIFKQLVDLKYSQKKHKFIVIHWIYSKGDIDLFEAGKIYEDMFPDLFFKFVEEDD